jgi:hypothetical protein
MQIPPPLPERDAAVAKEPIGFRGRSSMAADAVCGKGVTAQVENIEGQD